MQQDPDVNTFSFQQIMVSIYLEKMFRVKMN